MSTTTQVAQMAVPVYRGHCREAQFEWQHKLFKDFKKVTPESFTFACCVDDDDDTQESEKLKLSWQVKYYLTNLQSFGYNHATNSYDNFSVDRVKIKLLDKVPADYTVYVSIYIIEHILDIKFDSLSAPAVVKEISDLRIKNENNEYFIHVKIRILHQDKSIGRTIKNYNSYVKSEKSCNVTLKAGSEKFTAHMEILAAHSPVFASTFENEWIEGKTNTVDIKDVEPKILKHLIDYIYHAKVNSVDVQDWLKIIVAADKYLIDSLLRACEDFISNELNTENVAEVFTVADLVKSEKLKTDCVKFIVKNKAVVLQTEGYKNLVKTRLDLVSELFSYVMLCCSLVLEEDEK